MRLVGVDDIRSGWCDDLYNLFNVVGTSEGFGARKSSSIPMLLLLV